MSADLWAAIERVKAGNCNEGDIQAIAAAIASGKLVLSNAQRAVDISGDVSASSIFTGDGNVIADHFSGATPEQIRLIVHELIQELTTLEHNHPGSSLNFTEGSRSATDNPPFRKLVFDPTTVQAINVRLEIIKEISSAGYLSEAHQNELRQFKQQLQTFNTLNETFQSIAEESDRLIQSAIEAMRRRLHTLKLSGRTLAEAAQASTTKPETQQGENQIFQIFIDRLESSRLGADWISNHMESLINHAGKKVLSQFPHINASEKDIDDFKFSLKQFLEQAIFCLSWGTYDILDSPEIPLVLEFEQYEAAFQAMKESISKRLRREIIDEIEACLDYLIDRLPFY